jgi:tRNA(Ile2) C34 agmatinyltransferase TiaS
MNKLQASTLKSSKLCPSCGMKMTTDGRDWFCRSCGIVVKKRPPKKWAYRSAKSRYTEEE